MPYAPFFEQFRELALRETRSFTVAEGYSNLPADEYGLIELYCDDDGCDCQRVMFEVFSRRRNKSVAYIAYGWESSDFYRKWTKSGDPNVIREMQGPVLNELSPQTELAPALLALVRDTILKDTAYVERLKRHYQIFKEKVDPKNFPPSTAHLEQINDPIKDDSQDKVSAPPSTKPRKRSRRRAN